MKNSLTQLAKDVTRMIYRNSVPSKALMQITMGNLILVNLAPQCRALVSQRRIQLHSVKFKNFSLLTKVVSPKLLSIMLLISLVLVQGNTQRHSAHSRTLMLIMIESSTHVSSALQCKALVLPRQIQLHLAKYRSFSMPMKVVYYRILSMMLLKSSVIV